MNYWLHRISHEAEIAHPLLFKKGFLTIGFSDFYSQNFFPRLSEEGLSYLDELCQQKWGCKSRSRNNLKRFCDFQASDIVVVPYWKKFAICEIEGAQPVAIKDTYSDDLQAWNNKPVSTDGQFLFAENGRRYDLGFARKVKVLHEEISRADYAKSALTSRMKIRSTNADISDLSSDITQSIMAFNEKKPINLYEIIKEKTADIVLSEIKTCLTPDKFEQLIVNYFNAIGADEAKIPPKNKTDKEGDSDVIVSFEKLKLIIYVQAKHHIGTTYQHAVNQVQDYRENHEQTDDSYSRVAWVISTADEFDQTARNIAAENQVHLIDGKEFAEMLLNAGLDALKATY